MWTRRAGSPNTPFPEAIHGPLCHPVIYRSLTTLADHRYDTHAWLRNLLAATRRYTDDIDDIDDEHAHTIQQARSNEAPDPLAFDRIRPGEPGIPDRARLLLRYIESRKRERAEIQAAKAAAQTGHPPGDDSAPVQAR